MDTQRGFTRRFNYRGLPEEDPLLSSVFNDDFNNFQSSVNSNPTAYGNDAKLLYYIIKLKRWKMFNYILCFDSFNPNSVDNIGRSLLMNLAAFPSCEDYARALIEKGADVNWTDIANFTYLHMAAKEVDVDNTKIGLLVIDKGADINAQTLYGETSLFIACLEGNIDWIHFLLFHGADVSIESDKGILPIAATGRWIFSEKQKYIHELLFDYTFEDDTQSVHFSTLAEALVFETTLFSKIAEKVSNVTYDLEDLENFCNNLKYVKLKNLQLFVEKFGFLVKEIIDNCPLLSTLLELGWITDSTDLKGILDTFLESEYGADLVQSCKPYYSAIGSLVKTFHEVHLYVDEEEITKTACLMLSYGLEVTSRDLDVVYRFYGHCELFKILLHMDIVMISSDDDVHSAARLYYDLNTSIEDVLFPSATFLLAFYNHPDLKKMVFNHCSDKKMIEKVKLMPDVPSLVELSRNVARKFIVTSYKIKKSKLFYTVLNSLPIGKLHHSIIALERKIYLL